MTTRPLVFSSGRGMRECLRRGVGLCLCPEIAVRRDLAEGRLVRLCWDPAPEETSVLMIRHADTWCSPLLARFMEMAAAALLGE